MNSIQKCFNHVFLLEQLKNYQDGKEPHAPTVPWSCDMEKHCESANKKVDQLYKVSSHCLDDHQFKQEELGSVRELSEVCSCEEMRREVL